MGTNEREEYYQELFGWWRNLFQVLSETKKIITIGGEIDLSIKDFVIEKGICCQCSAEHDILSFSGVCRPTCQLDRSIEEEETTTFEYCWGEVRSPVIMCICLDFDSKSQMLLHVSTRSHWDIFEKYVPRESIEIEQI